MPDFTNRARGGPAAAAVFAFLAVAGLSLVGADRPARAEEPPAGGARGWPMFGGTPARNLVNTVDKNMPTAWNVKDGQRKNIKWVADLGLTSYGGPTIGSGKVFAGTNNDRPRNPQVTGDKGVVMCFRESDGKFLWQAVHNKLGNTENDYGKQGIASTPTVEGRRVYYVSNRCEVICVDTESAGDAKIIWRLDMVNDLKVFPRWLANGAPLLVGDLLFVATDNGIDSSGEKREVPAPKAPSLVAIDKKTGKPVWQDNSPGDKIMDGQWSSPAYAVVGGKPQVIFAAGDGWLRGFEAATGKPIWKFDCNPKASEYKAGGRGNKSFFLATPVVYENKAYIGVGQEPDDGTGVGHLWCVDITKTGDLSPVNDNFDPKDPVNKDSGLVWHYGGPAPKGGDREYVFGRTLSTCAVHDGLLYVAELEGYVHCLDARTGARCWVHDLKSNVWGSPYWVDGKVYIGNDDGDVYIFAHGKDKKLLGKVEMERPIKGIPVAANGVLYIQTDTQLFAIGH